MAEKWKARRKVDLGPSREASQFVWVLAVGLRELLLSIGSSFLRAGMASVLSVVLLDVEERGMKWRVGQQMLFIVDRDCAGCKTGVIPNGVDSCFIHPCSWQLTKARAYRARLMSICI